MRFGPAGNSDSYKGKSINDVPKYLAEMGLNAYEYQAGRGVKISKESAEKFGAKAREYGISLSIHSPYYVSLSSVEPEKRESAIDYIHQSAAAIDYMGGERVIVHSGSASKITRIEALGLAKETLRKTVLRLEEHNLSHIRICPELMGKINQLGNLEEVIELCKVSDSFIPCIDFGHLNSRTFGTLKAKDDFREVFESIKNGLGIERLREMHIHFSKIEYTQKGGEKKHLTFEDSVYGPNYEPLCELLAEYDVKGTLICESAGTQAEDAYTMKLHYEKSKI